MALKIKSILFIMLLFVPPALCQAQEGQTRQQPAAVIAIAPGDYRSYLETHPPLDRLSCSGNRCFFLVSSEEIEKIKRSGLNILSLKELPGQPPGLSQRHGDVNGLFHNYRESVEVLRDLEERFPGRAKMFSIGQSLEGRELYGIKISDNAGMEENEPNAVIVGCHHAREWISVEVPLLFARYVLEHFEEDADARRAVEGAQIYVVPVLNPDGLEYSIHRYRWWRKNRRYNGNLTWGVDINRNYGYKWGYDDHGSSPSPFSEGYRGPFAFSEPETGAIENFLLSHPPAGTLSYHSYSTMIIYPWGYAPLLSPVHAEMDEIARVMAEKIVQVNGTVYDYGQAYTTIYPTNGDMDDWVHGRFGVPAYTIELPAPDYDSGAFFLAESDIQPIFQENLPAMLYFVNYLVDKKTAGASAAGLSGPPPRKRMNSKRN
jgi:murein tripeptide amidase MpaA